MSDNCPALILDPKPPFRFGHRNPIVPSPNSAPNSITEVSSARRWKSRRLTALAGAGGSSPAAARLAVRARRE